MKNNYSYFFHFKKKYFFIFSIQNIQKINKKSNIISITLWGNPAFIRTLNMLTYIYSSTKCYIIKYHINVIISSKISLINSLPTFIFHQFIFQNIFSINFSNHNIVHNIYFLLNIILFFYQFLYNDHNFSNPHNRIDNYHCYHYSKFINHLYFIQRHFSKRMDNPHADLKFPRVLISRFY